ncbi:MAG TPA: hypothetical protein DEG43_04775 [Acidimicrobiaceae bacterium]|nr:hypothetical protein [Acidimicrobiaceae bacterium]
MILKGSPAIPPTKRILFLIALLATASVISGCSPEYLASVKYFTVSKFVHPAPEIQLIVHKQHPLESELQVVSSGMTVFWASVGTGNGGTDPCISGGPIPDGFYEVNNYDPVGHGTLVGHSNFAILDNQNRGYGAVHSGQCANGVTRGELNIHDFLHPPSRATLGCVGMNKLDLDALYAVIKYYGRDLDVTPGGESGSPVTKPGISLHVYSIDA